MKTRALKVTLIVLVLLAGAAFAVGHDDHPCTGEDQVCTDSVCTCESGGNCSGEECDCDTKCDDCTCDSLSRAEETSAPIEEIEEPGCQGCPGNGCR